MSIKSITLNGFKQFDNFTITCKETNILVGPNNSGKSTTLDALRALNNVARFARRHIPKIESNNTYGHCASYTLLRSSIGISIQNIVRNYGEDDAIIKIVHENANELYIHLHPDRPIKAYLKTDNAIPRTKNAFQTLFPLQIVVVPTLGPLEDQEAYVTDDTVEKNENTRLAHRNFRNIWLRKSDEAFSNFAQIVNKAWPEIVVRKPSINRYPTPHVEMMFEELRIPREVYWAGFGFQVWMQMITHILKGNEQSILVLDEPDIYLHPDLQRKLVKLVKERFGQVFIATHSTEIINEAHSGDILLISRHQRHARRISTEEGYREIFSYLGSSENSEFARIARARRVVFFEGKDRKIFRKFITKIAKTSLLEDQDTVFLQSGGFEQWRRISEVNWTLENMFGMNVKIAAIFDRDYRCSEQISSFLAQVNSDNVKCHVLSKKEIENYALNKNALIRAIQKRASTRDVNLEVQDAENLIKEITDGMYYHVQSQIIAKHLDFHKTQRPNIDESSILKVAMPDFDKNWADEELRLSMIPGKDFISTLSAKLQEAFGTGITITNLTDEMKVGEVANDLGVMIRDLDSFFSR